MRPIDADALKKAMRMWPRTRQPVLIYTGTILKGIDDAPTLDYKDLVPQGEWELVRMDENDMPIYRCGNCKTKRYGNPPFCSHCGARMKGADT